MKIRSVTYFNNSYSLQRDKLLEVAATFITEVQTTFKGIDLDIQTIRFAAPPFAYLLDDIAVEKMVDYARDFEKQLCGLGYDYISLGPALPEIKESYQLIPDLIQNTENTFCSGMLTDPEKGLSLQAVRACGEIIHELSSQESSGFSNLYFAALGNVPPGGPFFPAAYHGQGGASFSIAVEGADLAVNAFSSSESFHQAQVTLTQEMERYGDALTRVSLELAKKIGAQFGGIDYSLAPYPTDDQSLGTALQGLGVPAVGDHGSLAAAVFLADSIDQADYLQTGFSGLMLPVLEDSILAKRAAEGKLGIKDLLLYAAVCGTGLDTIPLPGDTTPGQLSALLFDLGALSLRLDKPLTARLMPIPGKKAGDPTMFDFPFFKNSKVMDLQAEELEKFFQGDGYLGIRSLSAR